MADLQLTSAEQILAQVDKFRLSKGAIVPDDVGRRLGCTHYDGKYAQTDQPFLLEGVSMLHGMGFGAIKLYLGPKLPGYRFNSRWDLPENARLIDVAKHEYFRHAFEAPFSTFVLQIQPIGQGPKPRAGVSAKDFVADREQIEELATHLLETYRENPVTFILQHWEGDWMLRGSYAKWRKETVPADAPLRVDAMAAWLEARQAGVEAARKRVTKTQAKVLHATEANRVLDSLEGIPTVAKDVLPRVAVDLVSWSSYDGVNAKDAAVHTWRGIEILRHFMRPSPAGIENPIYVGEVGIPENERKPEQIAAFWDTALAVFFAHKLPWVIVWQLYCNELAQGAKVVDGRVARNADVRGFFLVKPDGNPSASGDYFSNVLNHAGKPL